MVGGSIDKTSRTRSHGRRWQNLANARCIREDCSANSTTFSKPRWLEFHWPHCTEQALSSVVVLSLRGCTGCRHSRSLLCFGRNSRALVMSASRTGPWNCHVVLCLKHACGGQLGIPCTPCVTFPQLTLQLTKSYWAPGVRNVLAVEEVAVTVLNNISATKVA